MAFLLLCLNTDGNESDASSPPGSPNADRYNRVPALDEVVVVDHKKKRRSSLSNLYHGPGGAKLPKSVLNNITLFQRKQKKVGSTLIFAVPFVHF